MSNIEEDFLTVDTPIPGQNYVCLSFVSPEKILKNKNKYFLHRFLKENAKKYDLELSSLEEQYDEFFYNNSKNIENDFYKENDFQTTVRGLKVRGIFDTKREAEVRAKVLQRKDKNFHVFVGQVGYWLPWDPDADDIENQEYQDKELNRLVQKYNENKIKKDEYFEQKKNKEKQNETLNKDMDINKDNEAKKDKVDKIENSLNEDDPWIKQKLKTNDGMLDIDN